MLSLTSSLRRIALVAVGSAAACSSVLMAALPEGWLLAGNQPKQYDCSVDPASSYNGQPAMYLKSKPGIKTSGFGMLMRSFDAAPYAGKRVRFSASVKSQGVVPHGPDDAWAGLWMRVDDTVHRTRGIPRLLALDDMYDTGPDRSIRGTRGWEYYSVVLDVPGAANRISTGIQLRGSGAVWLSGEKFEVVGPEVPVTASPAPDAPTNLNFEKTIALKSLAGRTVCGSQASVPAGWNLAGTKPQEYNCSVDPAASYDNQLSLYLKSRQGVQTTGFGTLMQGFSADKYVGKRVHLSGNLKSEGVESWGGLWMRVDDANHPRSPYSSSVAFDNMHDGIKDRSIRGTTGWKNYSVVLDVPEGATDIYIGFLLDGPGALWVNGLKVEVVGPEFPVTGKSEEGPSKPELTTFVKDGNVIQDPDFPVSFQLPPGWTLTEISRREDGQTTVSFEETQSKRKASVYYQRAQPSANPDATLRKSMEDRVRQRLVIDEGYHIRPESVQKRRVGGHPALSYVGEYQDVRGRRVAQYFVRVLGKNSLAQFIVSIPSKADIADFCQRFNPIVDSLRIP
jgi:hypothetical protein